MRAVIGTAIAFLVLPAVLPGQAPADTLPTVDQVLSRYITAVGGRTPLEGLDTRIATGREITDLSDPGPATTVRLEAAAAYPDRWSLTRSGPVEERTWCDGTRVWHTAAGPVGDGPAETGPHARDAFLLDPRGPLRLDTHFPGLRVTGSAEVAGRAVWVVENALPSAYNALHFDAETGLLLRIGYYWTLEDYRELDGVLVPTRIVQSRKGGSTTWIWDRVEHNRPVDPARFAPPAGH